MAEKYCPNANNQKCAYWRKLSSHHGSEYAAYACHYCLDHKHTRAVAQSGKCLSFSTTRTTRKRRYNSRETLRKVEVEK